VMSYPLISSAGQVKQSLIIPAPGTLGELTQAAQDLVKSGVPLEAGIEIGNGQFYIGWNYPQPTGEK
jgi:hypothetical protein